MGYLRVEDFAVRWGISPRRLQSLCAAVREVAGDAAGVTYDGTVYTVVATVTDNLDGTLAVAYAYEADGTAAQGVTFANVYTAPQSEPTPEPAPDKSPMTGDDLALWFALLFVSGGTTATLVFARKRRESQE